MTTIRTFFLEIRVLFLNLNPRAYFAKLGGYFMLLQSLGKIFPLYLQEYYLSQMFLFVPNSVISLLKSLDYRDSLTLIYEIQS